MAKRRPHHRKARKITPEAKAKLLERIKRGDDVKLTVDVNEMSKITAGQLRALCFDNENHPKAKTFLKAIEEMPDDMEVNVHKIDVLAVGENFEVEEHSIINGPIEEKLKKQGHSLNTFETPPERLSVYGETDRPFEPDSLANVRPEGSEGEYDPLADVVPHDPHAPHDLEGSESEDKDHYHGDLTEDPND